MDFQTILKLQACFSPVGSKRWDVRQWGSDPKFDVEQDADEKTLALFGPPQENAHFLKKIMIFSGKSNFWPWRRRDRILLKTRKKLLIVLATRFWKDFVSTSSEKKVSFLDPCYRFVIPKGAGLNKICVISLSDVGVLPTKNIGTFGQVWNYCTTIWSSFPESVS